MTQKHFTKLIQCCSTCLLCVAASTVYAQANPAAGFILIEGGSFTMGQFGP